MRTRLTSLLAGVIVMAAVGVAGVPSAEAEDPGGCVSPGGQVITCGGTTVSPVPGNGGPSQNGGGAPIDPALLDPTIGSGPTGPLTYTVNPSGILPGLPQVVDGVVDAVVQIIAGLLGYESCAGAPAIPSPTEVAQSYFNRSELPGPNAKIEPGRGIVSLPVYLQSGAQMTWQKSVPQTLYGPLTLKGESKLSVDWGDGTTVDRGPYTTPGASYSGGGGISHRYADDARYDITVRQVWSVTWQFGPAGGTLPVIEITDSVDNFPVIELQAVTD